MFAVLLALTLSAPDTAERQPPPRDARPSTAAGTAAIRGRVLAADTGKPLRRARVTLSGGDLGRDGRSASTSLDGRYEIAALAAGRYTIRVSRSGYLPLQYGQRRPLEPGKPLQLADHEAIDRIDFTLPRASVIRGQILDELAEPVADVQVHAMRLTWFRGRRRLVPVGNSVRTDEAGEYRLGGLTPGSYYVMATLRETWTITEDGAEHTMGYAPSYFPGSPSLTDARRITLAIGQSASNNNFALMPGRASTISGTAADSLGRPLAGRSVDVTQEIVGPGNMSMATIATTTTAAEGTFTIKNVSPGTYTLRTQATRDTESSRGIVLEVARQQITLDGADVTDVVLTTTSGWTLSGQITTEDGGVPDIAPSRFGVSATLVDPDAGFGPGGAPPPPPPPGAVGGGAIPDSGRVKSDWTFAVTPVFSAARVRVTLPEGWSVKAILHDGRDIIDTPVEMKSNEELSGLEVIVSNRVATVSGQLADGKGAPLQDGTVIVFAEDAAKWSDDSRWVRAVRPDQQGKYQVQGLPPGDYLAVAVDYVEEGLWNDPEYLESLRPGAQRLKLVEAESKTLSLKPLSR